MADSMLTSVSVPAKYEELCGVIIGARTVEDGKYVLVKGATIKVTRCSPEEFSRLFNDVATSANVVNDFPRPISWNIRLVRIRGGIGVLTSASSPPKQSVGRRATYNLVTVL